MYIKGTRVFLRAIEESDLEFLREMINDPELADSVAGWGLPVSKTQQMDWFSRVSKDRETIRLVAENERGLPVGYVSMAPIDFKNRVGTMTGLKLPKQYQGQGYGKDIFVALSRYCFYVLGLNRLEGEHLATNEASHKFHLSLGWKLEGVRRKAIFKNNQYVDMNMMGLLREEFEEYISKTSVIG